MKPGARSFRSRVAWVGLLSTVSALSAVFVLLAVQQVGEKRSELAARQHALAQGVAATLSAPLAFQDRAAAEEALGFTRNLAEIRSVQVFDRSGRLFAASGDAEAEPAAGVSEGSRFERGRHVAVVAVKLDGETLGSVRFVATLDQVNRALLVDGLIAVAMILLATAVAAAVARSLAGVVIAPVLELSSAMDRVRKGEDLQLRVQRRSSDEIGRLVDEFNALLERLQARDDALKTTMAELVAARDQAQVANEAKSTFLANMSHEIRTPLNGVLGMAQVMHTGELTSEQRSRLEVIRSSGEGLMTLLNDMLDLAKIEAGKLELEAIAFEVDAVARSVADAFTPLAAQKDVRFSLEIEPEASGWRLGDPTRLRQILFNLVSNAVKFTADGEVGVRIADHDGELRLTVRDTGVGIPPDKLAKLFRKFEQADSSTTRQFGGTGLGLAICRELAELMDGRITAESRPGSGSVFTVELALPRVEAPVRDTPQAGAGACAAARLRILAAEDNAVNRQVLAAFLGMLDAEVVFAENGREAVRAWSCGFYDLVLMDIMMPELDGLAATEEIRAAERRSGRPRTPIIALSANALKHQIELYLAAGMDGHVAKPIIVEALFETMEQVLEVREAA